LSELSNEPEITDDPLEMESGPPAQGTMVVTLLLLIAGFLLSSAMLFHYGLKRVAGDGAAEFNLAAWATQFASPTDQPKKPQAPIKEPAPTQNTVAENAKESGGGGIGKLFGGQSDRVKWPKLKLTGFGSSTDGQGGFAIINAKQYHPGQMIDEKVTVVEIRSQDVVVEYGGETRTLTVDLQNR